MCIMDFTTNHCPTLLKYTHNFKALSQQSTKDTQISKKVNRWLSAISTRKEYIHFQVKLNQLFYRQWLASRGNV